MLRETKQEASAVVTTAAVLQSELQVYYQNLQQQFSACYAPLQLQKSTEMQSTGATPSSMWSIRHPRTTLQVRRRFVAMLEIDVTPELAAPYAPACGKARNTRSLFGNPCRTATMWFRRTKMKRRRMRCPIEMGTFLIKYGVAAEDAQNGEERKSFGRVLLAVFRRVVLNPLVLVNISGITYNLVFGPHIPLVASRALKAASSTFTGVASFNIGLSLVELKMVCKKMLNKFIAMHRRHQLRHPMSTTRLSHDLIY
jgi:hypothetical protein